MQTIRTHTHTSEHVLWLLRTSKFASYCIKSKIFNVSLEIFLLRYNISLEKQKDFSHVHIFFHEIYSFGVRWARVPVMFIVHWKNGVCNLEKTHHMHSTKLHWIFGYWNCAFEQNILYRCENFVRKVMHFWILRLFLDRFSYWDANISLCLCTQQSVGIKLLVWKMY